MKPSMTTIAPDTKVKPKINHEAAKDNNEAFEIRCNVCGNNTKLK